MQVQLSGDLYEGIKTNQEMKKEFVNQELLTDEQTLLNKEGIEKAISLNFKGRIAKIQDISLALNLKYFVADIYDNDPETNINGDLKLESDRSGELLIKDKSNENKQIFADLTVVLD